MNYQDLYTDLEPHIEPIIRSLAARFARTLGMDVEDARQEARIAAFDAFRHYNYNKSQGGVRSYARTSIHNAFCGIARKASRASRLPHTVYEQDGQLKVARHRLSSLDELELDVGSEAPSPEDQAQASEVETKARIVWMKLYNALGDRERLVLMCQSRPSDAFIDFQRNIGTTETTNIQIAQFLGVSKNSVDWSIHKIRLAFLRIIERPEFSELIGNLVDNGEWPMIHVSNRGDDFAFVRETLNKRQLDPRPLPEGRDVAAFSDGCRRIIERYHWGAVVFLRRGALAATAVIEGRFNPLNGEVLGINNGFWRPITDAIPWYKSAIRSAKRQAMKTESAKRMPRCLGRHEKGDTECEGDKKGETSQDRAPCFYLDRCVAFQLLLKQTGTTQDDHLKYERVEESGLRQVYATPRSEGFCDELRKLVAHHDIRNGKITVAHPERPVTKLATKRELNRARSTSKPQTHSAAILLAAWYNKQLERALGRKFAAKEASAKPGELFIMDRMKSSGYFAVYAQKRGRRQVALTSVYPRPSRGSLEIRLALPFDEFTKLLNKQETKALQPEDYTGKDGAFKVRLRDVDKERATIIAQTFGRAIRTGIIMLSDSG